jgi:hypothetical protein
MASRTKIAPGDVYGKLTIMSRSDHCPPGFLWGVTLWVARCECGAELVVRGNNLRSGNTQSCGCFRRKRTTQHFDALRLMRHGTTDIPKHRDYTVADRSRRYRARKKASYGKEASAD